MTYYNDLKIPAFLFFEIAESEDLSKLVISGNVDQELLEKAWEAIYDLYYARTDDTRMRNTMEAKKSIALLKMKIDIVYNSLHVLSLVDLTDAHVDLIITKLKSIGINLDKSDNLSSSILQTLQIDLVNLKAQLASDLDKYNAISKEVGSTFTDDLVSLENVLERTISEDVSLAKYISLKKSAKDRVKRLKDQQNKKK